MRTMPQRKLDLNDKDSAHAAVLALVGDGSIAAALDLGAISSPSPAHALQRRLRLAYGETPGTSDVGVRLPAGARFLSIIGASLMLWAVIGASGFYVLGI
jgi:hypothetical protein